MGPLTTDQEDDARRAAEEVWFWDERLVKARGVQVKVRRGLPWAPLLKMQAEAVVAQMESEAEEVVSLTLEVT